MPRCLVPHAAALAAALLVAFHAGLPLSLASSPPAATPSAAREAAWRENNLGVALLEQFRFADAVQAFQRALAADATLAAAQVNLAIAHFYVPDIPNAQQAAQKALAASPDAPHPNYLLALVARSEGRAEEAVPYLQKVLAADPKDLGANVTLGQVYLQMRRFDDAAAAFRIALAAEPYNVSAAYNLGVALNRGDKREEAATVMARFQTLRDSPYKTALSSNYLEQGRYAEAMASTGAEPEAVDARTPAVSFVEKAGVFGAAVSPPSASEAAARTTLVLADVDGDGKLDALTAGPALRLLKNGGSAFSDAGTATGLAGQALAALAGDYDNDDDLDLLLVRPAGLALVRNEGGGRLQDVTAAAGLPTLAPRTASAAFVDVDHDGDLDLWAASRLLQNNGNGTFTDITEKAGLREVPDAVQVIPTDFDNRRDVDLFLLASDRVALDRNMRDGTFKDMASELGFGSVTGPLRSAAKGDLNKDGYEDFLVSGPSGGFLATSDGRGGFKVAPAPPAAAGAEAVQFVDYDNDGLLDVFVVGAKGLRLLRNLGASWADVASAAFSEELRSASFEGGALGLADLDRDGDADAIVATPSRLRLLENRGGNANKRIALALKGRVSNHDGLGAKVEIRAGNLRQKLETSAAVPMAAPAEVAFGLGSRRGPDAVRVIWASGIVQTETELAAGGATAAPVAVAELDRKPSSCPYLYTWNGERFEFVTDFLGGGEMGYQHAPGVWSVPDPVELVRIAPEQLRPRDGRYELRVTNELEEVLYLDRLQLVAIDHPKDVLVYPEEGLTASPKPERILAARDPRGVRAVDHQGRDVSDRLLRLDRSFVDGLPVERVRGYAREHALTFDLSAEPRSHTLLLLTGWTDYAFSSDNVAAHQAGLVLAPPRLEVEQADGSWATAIGEIGIPVGRPQTVVVDLAGKLGPSRRARVVTSMRVYWDQAQLAAPAAPGASLAKRELAPLRASLRERGFSAEASADGREPWVYDYARVSALSTWKTLPGRYTRLGDVRPLLAASDDRMVVSKPGDEVELSFDARALGTVRPGWTRTFLLRGDGFSKEMDKNSASPDVVLPLPFHGMKAYPYADAEVPPRVRRVFEEAERWNTRAVVRPITPIELFATNREDRQ
jgi:tetratricopeptide (TPR) repeat protein